MRWSVFAVTAVVCLTAISPADAQYDYRGGRGRRSTPRFPEANVPADRRFVFGRIMYTSVRREALGTGWTTDYPDGDMNFMRRLEELTSTPVALDANGFPAHVVVTLTSDEIFDYPFVFMSDVGTVGFSEEEALRLRDYLFKGGFLYVDDFWGEYAWEHWQREIGKVLPPGEFPIFDIPPGHAVMHAVYDVRTIPQIPSIQYWRTSGGGISERGAESAEAHLRGIEDKNGRLMVVMSHNTDIADGWEREGEEYEFFHRFSFDAYAIAINIVAYALTH